MDPAPVRERLVVAAAELFSARGYAATSVGDLAGRLGVTKAAVYYHFRAKDDLLAAVVEPYLGRLRALVAEAEERPACAETARWLLRRYLGALLECRDVAVVAVRDVSVAAHPAVAGELEGLHRRLTAVLAGPASAPRAEAALGALCRPVTTLGGTGLEPWAEELVDAALGALGAGAGEEGPTAAGGEPGGEGPRRRWASFARGDPGPAAEARRFVAEALGAWGLDDGVADRAVLLAHELVVNALTHARSDVDVAVVLAGRRLRVEVADADPRLPSRGFSARPEPEPTRGLPLVAAAADAWGVDQRRPDGKTVWFEVALAAA